MADDESDYKVGPGKPPLHPVPLGPTGPARPAFTVAKERADDPAAEHAEAR
jgi:hypothetical protein